MVRRARPQLANDGSGRVIGSKPMTPSTADLTILHVNKFLYRRGGAEAYMLDVAELQEQDGHQTSFFSMKHPDNLPSPHQDDFPSNVELDPAPSSPLGRLRVSGRIMYSKSARCRHGGRSSTGSAPMSCI